VASFPEECRRVLLTLREVYRHDAHCREQGLSPPERLAWHQEHSGPSMQELRAWMAAQLAERLVEPNSGLGEAMRYTLKHWQALTLFLRAPGAPLDNTMASYCTSFHSNSFRPRRRCGRPRFWVSKALSLRFSRLLPDEARGRQDRDTRRVSHSEPA
jgi:hypothetical protein